MSARRGFTLVELLVAMVITSIVGVTVTKLFLSQARFYDLQSQMRRARFVSRTAVNAALSDMRMAEPTGGVVSVSPTTGTLRGPYAIRIVCANRRTPATLA